MSSANRTPTIRTAQEVQGESDRLVDQLDQFMAAMDQAVANDTWPPIPPCPYHMALLQYGFDGQARTTEQAEAMDHFQVEAAVQPSMLQRGDGNISTHKDCNCWMLAVGGSS